MKVRLLNLFKNWKILFVLFLFCNFFVFSYKRSFSFFFQTITEKTKLVLTTKVTGIPRPKITWFREEVEVKQTYKTKITYAEDVATLTINTIEKRQTGIYKCVAKNTAGSAETVCQITIEGQ